MRLRFLSTVDLSDQVKCTFLCLTGGRGDQESRRIGCGTWRTAGIAHNGLQLRHQSLETVHRRAILQNARLYRGRADCENRIKELKADFGLGCFVRLDFWAKEAALGMAMLAYNLMGVFRHGVMRQRVQHTLSTLHHRVLAVGAFWDSSADRSEK